MHFYIYFNTVPEIIEIKLPSRIESVEEAAAKADEFARSRGYGDEVIFAVDLAIRESVANAVKHGNKFDESKDVEVNFSDSKSGFEITVRDFGSGFSVEDIPDPTDPENLLKSDGRGILFIRSFMDEVEWSNPEGGGLMVKMLKKP
jgi:serine/threonine-protein kinase RsbW